jgi:alpha-mannosidase
MLWDEHTWGAHNSISAPDLPFVTGQWKNKRQFALDADQMSRALLARLRPLPARRPQNEIAVDVLNTTSWLRSDLVFLSPAESAVGDQVLDEKGNPVPSQRLSTGELAVLAENVPPLSARRFLVKPGKALSRGNCRASSGSLDNSLLSVVIDQKRGAILSLTWREKMIELVDRAKGSGLNQYLYVLGKDAAKAQPLSGVKTRVKENGSLVSSVLIEAEAPGCRKYSAEVRIVDSIARVEIINQIDKRAVRAKEAVHIAFPFHIPGGQIRYDVADGIVRPEADQLAGSCKNFFSLQNWVDISNGEYGVTWTSADAPLIEIGSITAEKPWMESVSSSVTIYSYVMNNYWHTNYKADQEGRTSFRYSIWPHAGFRPAMAVRLGREAREPLVPMIADPADQPLSSLLQIRPAEILLASLKPAAGGSAWLLCLYNPTSASLNAAIEWNPNLPVVMRQSDISGHPGPEIKGELKISAGGSAFVRAEKK